MSLQIQYRPKSLKMFFGNDDIKASLKNLIKRENPPSAFLLTGPSGCGKTTLARIIRSGFKCHDMDWKELNAADDRGIDAIRQLISKMSALPMSGTYKVFLLDEAHMLTKPSQEALLKALEEPPPHVKWIICTTNPEALKVTFKRRCHTYELEPLTDDILNNLVETVLNREKRSKYVTQEVREKIFELSEGSPGQAMKLLDMVIDMDDPKRAMNTLVSAGTSESEVIEICRTLCNYNMPPRTKWGKIKSLIKGYKGDGESARRPILGYLNKVLLNKTDPGESENVFFMMQPFRKNFFDDGIAGLTCACYESIFGDEE